jgi:glycosyltransferase involved in cell wall biosynthesis
MFKGCRVAVVVPAFNEATKIARTLRSIPGFVDHVIVVDDASADGTGHIARRSQRPGLAVIRHQLNRGVGAAIATGYAAAFEAGADVSAVMAGDSQMDPADLTVLIDAVVSGRADYAKGNRFAWPGVYRVMPASRMIGNVVLSHLTRLASGYWHVFDSQCGYTVANRRALAIILSGEVFPRYGYPNDLLCRLGSHGARVVDVPVRPVYGNDWHSGIRILSVVVPLLRLVLRGICARLMRGIRHVVPDPLRGEAFGTRHRPSTPPTLRASPSPASFARRERAREAERSEPWGAWEAGAEGLETRSGFPCRRAAATSEPPPT